MIFYRQIKLWFGDIYFIFLKVNILYYPKKDHNEIWHKKLTFEHFCNWSRGATTQ